MGVLAQGKASGEDLVFQIGETERSKRIGGTIIGS